MRETGGKPPVFSCQTQAGFWSSRLLLPAGVKKDPVMIQTIVVAGIAIWLAWGLVNVIWGLAQIFWGLVYGAVAVCLYSLAVILELVGQIFRR